MKKSILTILIFLNFTNNIIAQNQNLFKEVNVQKEIYYNWIADWSFEKENDFPDIADHCVYQFNKNDTLYIMRNEKVSYKYPFKFYEYNDSTYLSLHDNGMKIISRGHLDAMWTNLQIIKFEKDSFLLFKGYSRSKNVFYKSTSRTIKKDEYLDYFVGKEFKMRKMGKRGMNKYIYRNFHLFFNTDSTYVLTITNTVIYPQEKKEEETVSVYTFPYKIVEDKLVLESDNKNFRALQLPIKQRIGRTKNKLIVDSLMEIKK
jgi:hypothetical protein